MIEQQQQQHAWLHLDNIPFLLYIFFERFILSENHRLVFSSSSSIHPSIPSVIKRKQDEPFEALREGLGSFSLTSIDSTHTHTHGTRKRFFSSRLSSYNKQGSRHFSPPAPATQTLDGRKKSDKMKRNTPRIGKKMLILSRCRIIIFFFSNKKVVTASSYMICRFGHPITGWRRRIANGRRRPLLTFLILVVVVVVVVVGCKERINKTWPHFHRLWWWWPTVLWPAPTYI